MTILANIMESTTLKKRTKIIIALITWAMLLIPSIALVHFIRHREHYYYGSTTAIVNYESHNLTKDCIIETLSKSENISHLNKSEEKIDFTYVVASQESKYLDIGCTINFSEDNPTFQIVLPFLGPFKNLNVVHNKYYFGIVFGKLGLTQDEFDQVIDNEINRLQLYINHILDFFENSFEIDQKKISYEPGFC